jgi:glycosyltransferase involved in cell wall biosynthesis
MDMISVVIPLYNKEKYIKSCIESILCAANNASVEVDIIVVDDCSTDKSQEVVSCFSEQVNYIKLDVNKGPSYARNCGVINAKNDLVYFIDADDFVDINFFFELTSVINSFPDELVYVFGIAKVSGEAGFKCKPTRHSIIQLKPMYEFHRNLCRGELNFTASSVCVRKRVFDSVGFFNEESRYSEDAEFWARLSERCNTVISDSVVCYYRSVPDSLSQINFKNLNHRPILLSRLFCQMNEDAPPEVGVSFSLMFLKYLFLVGIGLSANKEIIWSKEYIRQCVFPYGLLSSLVYVTPSFFLKYIFSLYLRLKKLKSMLG